MRAILPPPKTFGADITLEGFNLIMPVSYTQAAPFLVVHLGSVNFHRADIALAPQSPTAAPYDSYKVRSGHP
jgi:hypothetical protein